jgi:phosphate starvation-inducible membrane PsiE
VNLKKIPALLRSAESVVLTLIAVLLVVLAVVLLVASVKGMVGDIAAGMRTDAGIEVLNSILLVMMIMEIVYTVTKSLESHILVAEPFLIIGAIAAIRRMIVITAESTKIQLTNPEVFRSLLIELAVLAMIVVSMAFSVWLLRHSNDRNIVSLSEEV